MSPNPIEELVRTGEHENLDDDADASSETLEHQALEPATEAFVKNHGRKIMRRHIIACPVRRLRWWFIFLAGGLLVGQAAAVIIVRLSIAAGRAEVRETVRQTVEQVLREKKIIGDFEMPVNHLQVAVNAKEVP